MFEFFLIFTAWFLLLFVSGSLIYSSFIKYPATHNLYTLIFRNTFLGYILFVTIFSIWKTHFETINIIYLLLLLFSLLELKKSRFAGKRNINIPGVKISDIIFLLTAWGFVFIYMWMIFYNSGSILSFNFHYGDYVNYSRISHEIAKTGQENGFGVYNELNHHYHGSEPYHYFDLWGGAIVNKIFGINNYLSLVLIIYPLFYFLVICGLISLLKRVTITNFLITLTGLWVGGITFHFYNSWHFLSTINNFSFNMLTPGIFKLSYFYVFILAAFLLSRQGLYSLSILVFSGLALANIVSAPSVSITVFFMEILFYYLKFIDKRQLTRLLIYVLITGISIIIYYALFKNEYSGIVGVNINEPLKLISINFQKADLITQLHIIMGSALSIVILYFFYIISAVAFIHNWSSKKSIFYILTILMAGIGTSILSWAITYRENGSVEVFYNFAIPLINSFIMIVIVFIVGDRNIPKVKRVWMLTPLILLSFINIYDNIRFIDIYKKPVYSDNYLKSIYKQVEDHSYIASLKSSEILTNPFEKLNAIYPLGNYLVIMKNDIGVINIGDLNTPIDSTSAISIYRSKKAIENGIFYRYYLASKIRNKSVSDLQIEFLKKYHIRQLIASKNAVIPPDILTHTNKIITDSLSGEKFITFDLNP